MPETTYARGASRAKLVEDILDIAEESDAYEAQGTPALPKPPVVTVTLGTTRPEEAKTDEEQKELPQA